MSLGDRALSALVRRRLKGRKGVVVWVDEQGSVRLLGVCGRADLEGLAWGLDIAYRQGARAGVGERVRLSGLRRVAHTLAEGTRGKPLP